MSFVSSVSGTLSPNCFNALTMNSGPGTFRALRTFKQRWGLSSPQATCVNTGLNQRLNTASTHSFCSLA
jgi:hypothetical protein